MSTSAKHVLWAPWRLDYIVGPKEKGCIFCTRLKSKKDQKNLILFRAKHSFVILNKYPYNNGHLMITPKKHTADLEKLPPAALQEMMSLTQEATRALKRAFGAKGFNVGMNLGRCGGAGVEDHLHLHVVPRWEADTNFMPVLANVKVMPENLETSYRQLKKYWRHS